MKDLIFDQSLSEKNISGKHGCNDCIMLIWETFKWVEFILPQLQTNVLRDDNNKKAVYAFLAHGEIGCFLCLIVNKHW